MTETSDRDELVRLAGEQALRSGTIRYASIDAHAGSVAMSLQKDSHEQRASESSEIRQRD